MVDLRQQYHDYQLRYPDEDDILEELDKLIDNYDVINETSLKNPFLEVCFEHIDPDQDWRELVESHEDYAEWWWPQKTRATALRMLLTEQIGWPEHQGLLEFDREYLLPILFAIKEGVSQHEDHNPVTLPLSMDLEPYTRELPNRTLPELDFPTLLTFSIDIEADATAFLEEQDIDPANGNHHIVYVICCTPETENETSAISSIRRYAQAKSIDGYPLSDQEAAASFLNESKCILYVGSTSKFPVRMEEHYKGVSTGGAECLNLYKPRRLLEVTAYDSDEEADTAEIERARELDRVTDCYVFQN